MQELWQVRIKFLDRWPPGDRDTLCTGHTEGPFDSKREAENWANQVIDEGCWLETDGGTLTFYPPHRLWLITIKRWKATEEAVAKQERNPLHRYCTAMEEAFMSAGLV